MVKYEIKYRAEIDKIKAIEVLTKNYIVKKISKPYKSGENYRIYVDVE